MTTVTNAHGKQINFDAAVVIMDDDLLRELEGTGETEQAFFDAYCKAHEAKFGEEFEPAKANPVW